MNSSSFSPDLTRSWPLLALLLIAAVWLHRTPYSASNLEVPPDTVEYALTPLQFLETGRYEIIMEGRSLPSRYPPWFPMLVILPAYVLFGHDPGNAIIPVTVLAVAGVGFAYAIGRRISSTTGGVLAAVAVLILPSYSRWATQVMTDVPCTALMLATCLVFLRLQAKPRSALLHLGAGLLVAVTTLFRPVFAAMLLPFLLVTLRQGWKGLSLRRLLLLLAPMTAAAAATFAYNASTFGSPFRNGYKFWATIPMDYPTMMFSPSYLPTNLKEIGSTVFPILLLVCVGAWLLVRVRRPAALAASRQPLQDVAVFFTLTTTPILLFHLFYFYPDDRFHIPVLAGTGVLAGSLLALLLGPGRETVLKVLLPVMFLLAISARIASPSTIPLRRIAAERVRKHTPDNAIVISAIDPVYIGRMAGAGSSRRIVPLSRGVDYAGTLLVKKRVDDPRLRLVKWDEGRAIALVRPIIRPHAEEAVRFVASERMDELAMEVAKGTPVFFDSSFVYEHDEKVVTDLQSHFRLVQRAPYLFQLQSR